MNTDKINIRNLSLEELKAQMIAFGQQAFRAKQVYEWLWNKNAHAFDEMSSLSKELRAQLETHFYIDGITVADQQISSDKTIKCAFEIEQGKVVEGVLIPTSSRMTACISSQVGCSLSCTFCATGRLKLLRNLSAGEIADAFNISKPSISHHLDILKRADLITSEKNGQFIIYSINTTIMEDVLQWILTFKK